MSAENLVLAEFEVRVVVGVVARGRGHRGGVVVGVAVSVGVIVVVCDVVFANRQ